MDTKEMQAMLAAKMAEPPPTRGDPEAYKPRLQPYYRFLDNAWREVVNTPHLEAGSRFSSFYLLSWNIDVLVPFGEPRMHVAIDHLEALLSTIGDSLAVIFFQEMDSSDIQQLQSTPWIQSRFYMTDASNSNWQSPYYGTTTLVDRRLQIQTVFRVPWVTKFERDGLFVDIGVSSDDGSPAGHAVRLCNTHLESLVADPPVRPGQLQDAAEWMQKPNVLAAVLAGDLNAIEPFDRTLHSENGLKDVYLEFGGREDSDDGYTWGIQVPEWMKQRFGSSRMDKILYCGDVTPRSFRRIGMGVKVEDPEIVKQMREQDALEWASDHFGVMGEMVLGGGTKLSLSRL
ncbi:hypothetical protein P152DRAFT_459059 [Eremomyces bilateralis CBS 781.70]|uniref:Endonuclease/exonuclease/phosphatase domain-containing protein n=1 Tax=Eremomyces bilateralis CBS 781.70 TaxID=1392243 RepID=A0A6G1G221_9PEZI|nr:uncharacterized protein P152DRAFT_459059 [Eremomyces bilateralis CBS 781.70]KAF1812104.1 hypothetical protein P152DRAFT_459059 [Eremomyces bilateralis CBS 781.70]